MSPAFEKQTVTPVERWVGFGVLLALAVIALGVYIAQFRLNPAVSARQDLGEPDNAMGRFALADLAPDGIKAYSAPERFDPDTLSLCFIRI